MAGYRFVFGEFELDPSRASLMRGDAPVSLRPKAFDALRHLVENPGRIVTKDELIGAVWPDVVVTDDSLAKCIQEVREALGDRPPRYVRTVPRRGYLFDVAVTRESSVAVAGAPAGSAVSGHAPATDSSSEPAAAGTAPAGVGAAAASASDGAAATAAPSTQSATGARESARPSRYGFGLAALLVLAAAGAAAYFLFLDDAPDRSGETPSIAVLPFLNLSSDANQEYFSDGLAEELLNKLAKLEGLRVAARTSSFTFKGSNDDVPTIAARLGVDNVLEGSVRKDGDSIRITAQLIEAENGTHLWSETYERELDDIFAIQDDIAESIAAELRVTLGIADREALRSGTENVEAFDQYLAGTALLNEFGTDQTALGIERLQRATAIDPEYADAWAVLSLAYIQSAYFNTRDFDLAERQADEAARRALALNPNLAPAHAALAHVHIFRGDWVRAEQEVATAVSIPSDFNPAWDYAEVLQAAGYLEEALEYRKQARQVLSINVAPATELAMAYHQVGDDESAEAELQRAEDLVGDRDAIDGTRLMFALGHRDEEIIESFLTEAIDAGNPVAASLEPVLDAPETAGTVLRRLRDTSGDSPNARGRLALWAAYFGEPALAVELIRDDALEAPLDVQRIWLPLMRDARRTQAFEDLVTDLGLVDFWRVRGWPTLCRPLGGDGFECY